MIRSRETYRTRTPCRTDRTEPPISNFLLFHLRNTNSQYLPIAPIILATSFLTPPRAKWMYVNGNGTASIPKALNEFSFSFSSFIIHKYELTTRNSNRKLVMMIMIPNFQHSQHSQHLNIQLSIYPTPTPTSLHHYTAIPIRESTSNLHHHRRQLP